MDNSRGVPPPVDEATNWEAAVKPIFEQMEQADARIREYQAEIDQLKVETRALLAQMKEQIQGAA
jgi:F0F1-type ATP synthase membrane subunit b/b'